MGAATLMAFAVFIVSFMCELFIGTRAGLRGAFVCGVFVAVLPVLARAVLRNAMFEAHVTAAADPLEPEAKVVAGGVKAAMRHCLATGRKVNLLVAGVPGCVVEIGLDAVSSRCEATIQAADGYSTSRMTLPVFTPGASPSWFRLRGGEPLRLVFEPPVKAGGEMRCGVFEVPTWAVAATVVLFAAAVTGVAGMMVLVAVLPCAVAGLLADAWMRFRRWRVMERAGAWRWHALQVALYAAAIWNLHRLGML